MTANSVETVDLAGPAFAEKLEGARQTLREAAAMAPAALATSLSAEDMVLTEIIAAEALPITIFTLDTGRLHEETVAMIGEATSRFGLPIEIFRPDPAAVEAYVTAHGANAFYESVDLRKACCGIRKVEPLGRALADKKAWVTGQRREQGLTRAQVEAREFDAAHGIWKFNPLADWAWAETLAYAQAHDIPVNPLHKRGYPSIGCDPCTRAIRPGEDFRAGRWWWEQSDSKECGLHVSNLTRQGATT